MKLLFGIGDTIQTFAASGELIWPLTEDKIAIFEKVAEECRKRGAGDERADPGWWEEIGYLFCREKELQEKYGERLARKGGFKAFQKALREDCLRIFRFRDELTTPEARNVINEALRNLLQLQRGREDIPPERQNLLKKWFKDRRVRRNWLVDEALLWVVKRLKKVGVCKVYFWAGGILYGWGLLSREYVGLSEGETYLNILNDRTKTREERITQRLKERAYRARKRMGKLWNWGTPLISFSSLLLWWKFLEPSGEMTEI